MVDAVVAVQWLEKLQNTLEPYPGAYLALMISALLIAAGLANWVTKRILVRGLRRLLQRLPGAESGRGSHLMRVISRLSNVVPSQVIASGITLIPDLPPGLVNVIIKLCIVWAVLTVSMAFSHALDAANSLYERKPDARNKPIKGYLQVVKIVVFVAAGLSIIATLLGVALGPLVTGLGAATAVLMLIFQDTILSLVASVQISGDGRVRIGDWIEMPSQNADGDVIDIALHTITVQNFDKTITTIPTKKLVTESSRTGAACRRPVAAASSARCTWTSTASDSWTRATWPSSASSRCCATTCRTRNRSWGSGTGACASRVWPRSTAAG
jgi:miniconductance mechanosensitive channel